MIDNHPLTGEGSALLQEVDESLDENEDKDLIDLLMRGKTYETDV